MKLRISFEVEVDMNRSWVTAWAKEHGESMDPAVVWQQDYDVVDYVESGVWKNFKSEVIG